MTLKALEKGFKSMRNEMPAGIIKIRGEFLPDLPLCGNFMQLTGRSIALGIPHFDATLEYENAHKELRRILYIELHYIRENYDFSGTEEEYQKKREIFRAEAFEKLFAALKRAYVDVNILY